MGELYGIASILGFQVIGEKHKNHDQTANYIHHRGISWIIMGIPWLILYLLTYNKDINKLIMCLLILACTIPSIIYSFLNEPKYRHDN